LRAAGFLRRLRAHTSRGGPTLADVVWERLESQIAWYDARSARNQRAFKRLKYAEIVAAASIPVVAGIDGAPLVIPAVLGALVVVVESILHLNQYHENWLTYRSAAETLRSERVLYLARAGYYASAPDPHALLAERMVAMSSRENTKWAAQQEQEAAAAAASQTTSTP
jgi:hypothetical protein